MQHARFYRDAVRFNGSHERGRDRIRDVATRGWSQRAEAYTRRGDLSTNSAGSAVKALFGASHVLALEYMTTEYYDNKELIAHLERLGYDAVSLRQKSGKATVYAENMQQDASEALKPLLMREALRYGLACSETAFIAVRKEAGKLVEETTVVANALPSGWSEDFLSGGASAQFCMSAAAPAWAPPYMVHDSLDCMLSDIMPANADMNFTPLPPSIPSPKAAPAQSLSRGGGIVGAVAGLFKRAVPGTAAGSPDMEEAEDDAAGVDAVELPRLFAGQPVFVGREAVLFDTSRQEDAGRLAAEATLSRLTVRFPAGMGDAAAIDNGLIILIYMDDLALPRARVRIADLIKQGGVRPLNLQRRAGQALRIVLQDPNGAWASNAPEIALSLE